jgi:glycyl-tRNA synthetase alpha subunit
VTQVACIEDSKNDATVGILSVIFEHWVTGYDVAEYTVNSAKRSIVAYCRDLHFN